MFSTGALASAQQPAWGGTEGLQTAHMGNMFSDCKKNLFLRNSHGEGLSNTEDTPSWNVEENKDFQNANCGPFVFGIDS